MKGGESLLDDQLIYEELEARRRVELAQQAMLDAYAVVEEFLTRDNEADDESDDDDDDGLAEVH
jgi:hypothetical protein